MSDTHEVLASIVGAANVASGDAISDDLTHDEGLGVEPHRPDVVVWPESTAAVAAVVAHANDHRIPVTARGAASGSVSRPVSRPARNRTPVAAPSPRIPTIPAIRTRRQARLTKEIPGPPALHPTGPSLTNSLITLIF